jgi:hypothetical protein
MPEFLYEWLKAIVYFLNLLLGNVGFVKYLKDIVANVKNPPAFVSFFPIAFFIAVILVIWLLFITRVFGSKKRGPVKVAKKR